ncbi:hypothetical protein VPH35_084814 [Triticum aestivum]|uniref:uncharacterized protein n=1 Tax=Triticum aestivum TaxID=4565 RepID=UPI001D00638F|nr:uncharacterized protein LOC123107608 [Triticum aestivum]
MHRRCSSPNSTAMTSELGTPYLMKHLPPTLTTITALGDDLLCEIFLRLPSLPSLVRVALACRTFLQAICSSPAFRRCFQALHPPELLGFFIQSIYTIVPHFAPLRNCSDPDMSAAVRGSDLSLTRLSEDIGSSLEWDLESFYGPYLVLINQITAQIVAYNPLTLTLDLIPWPPIEISRSSFLEFHIIFSEEDQGVFRMVCVQHHRPQLPHVEAYIAVFSTTTRKWQVLPWVETPPPPQPEDDDDIRHFYPGMPMKGFIYWKQTTRASVVAFNTTTLQFCRVDLPPLVRERYYMQSRFGHTKDGKLCMVGADDSGAKKGMLIVWVWRADDDGVEKWMLEDTFPLSKFVDATKSSTEDDARVQVEVVIDGFVYLSIKYGAQAESLLSLCLETAELNNLLDDARASRAHPYLMAWPSSLVCNRQTRA